jgi:hypothetical protein
MQSGEIEAFLYQLYLMRSMLTIHYKVDEKLQSHQDYETKLADADVAILEQIARLNDLDEIKLILAKRLGKHDDAYKLEV